MEIDLEKLASLVYEVRGQRVMLDGDLANLYGVATKRLAEQVKRNIKRFPADFMFLCDNKELEHLRSQFTTSNPTSHWNHKRRDLPMLFTENGVAMLSGVLRSD